MAETLLEHYTQDRDGLPVCFLGIRKRGALCFLARGLASVNNFPVDPQE